MPKRYNKIKVIQTPIRFLPSIGGVENHVYYLSRELVKNGVDVTVYCSNIPKSDVKKLDGIEIKRLNSNFNITNTNIALSLPFCLLKEDFDIIHTHMPTPWTADWSVLIAKLKHKKSIITIHNDMDKPDFIGKLITKIYLNTVFRLTLSLVDKIIVVNPGWETTFRKTNKILARYKNKIKIVPNGIDTNLFRPLKNIKKEKNTVLFVSVLDKHHKFKGLDYLLEAIKLVKKTIPSIKLIVVGEGELKNIYIEKTKNLGISENVMFVGEKNQKELVSYYNMASVFVLPSTDIEGFGIVLLESLACKTPVITTNIVGLSNNIKKSNCGLIVNTRDYKSLSDTINYLSNNKLLALKMGLNGGRLIKSRYQWKVVSKQICDIYDM